jgi:hypothetical protein
MNYTRRFKDAHIVSFDGDTFEFEGRMYEIRGMTGVDIDNNTVQVRDDLWIGEVGTVSYLKFGYLCHIWEKMQPALIKLVKTKHLIRRDTAA